MASHDVTSSTNCPAPNVEMDQKNVPVKERKQFKMNPNYKYSQSKYTFYILFVLVPFINLQKSIDS